MKLNEIAAKLSGDYPPFLTDKKEIENWLTECTNYAQRAARSYDLNDKGEIDCHFGVTVYQLQPAAMAPGRLSCKFGKIVAGHFDLDDLSLTTLEGSPHFVDGFFSCNGNKLTSFEYVPRHIKGNLRMESNNIKSLIGIETAIDFVSRIEMDFVKIKNGGIGLILIGGLTEISSYLQASLPAPFKIIEKYLCRPDDIFECQMELIDAGYEAYAQL